MERAAKALAVAATIGMFLVLIMGATVTNTGSSEGCGKSWPLCHGQFIPEYAFETMVELSHRLVTGVEGFLILGLAITAFPLRRRYPELKVLLPLMIFTLILQSGMGAWAVMYPQTPPVLATHFGISLVAFASVFLVMRVLWESTQIDELAAQAVPTGYRNLAWFTPLWAIVIAYLGAYLRHSGTELACYTWPLCNGALIPDFSLPGVGAQVLVMEPGTRSFDELVGSIDHGLYVNALSGLHSGVNPVSGDFSVGADGLMIRGGSLAEPVREMTLASTLQRLLLDIVEVGGDLEWLSSGDGLGGNHFAPAGRRLILSTTKHECTLTCK